MKKPIKKIRNQWTKLQHIFKYETKRAGVNGEIICVRTSFLDTYRKIAYGVKRF